MQNGALTNWWKNHQGRPCDLSGSGARVVVVVQKSRKITEQQLPSMVKVLFAGWASIDGGRRLLLLKNV
jgi:hypothetical protein